MPFLDPDRPGSALNLALETANDITDSFVGSLQRVSALQASLNKMIGEIVQFQADINLLKNKIFEFADNLASTGVFIHSIGRDGTLHNNQAFSRAVRQCLFDTTDPGRPTFRGDTAVVAGFIMVVGAPDPRGLTGKFKAIEVAINGFGGKFNAVKEATGRAGEAFGELNSSLTTSEVDPAYKVAQSAPQRGGTQSTLLNTQIAAAATNSAQPAATVPVAAITVNNGKANVAVNEVASTVTTAEGPSAVETPLVSGETTTPTDSGASTLGIAPQLRAAKKVQEGTI